MSDQYSAARDPLGELDADERYVVNLHLPVGLSFEAAARRLNDVANVVKRQFGQRIETADAELSREFDYGQAVRIYSDPVRAAVQAQWADPHELELGGDAVARKTGDTDAVSRKTSYSTSSIAHEAPSASGLPAGVAS